MIRPDIDGKLAARVREIASLQTDSNLAGGTLTAKEKERILNIAADVFEEYILAMRKPSGEGGA